MSIKDLFGSSDKQRNLLESQTEKDAFSEIESSRNLKQLNLRQKTYLPNVDYIKPETFAKFGSAYLYYKSAIERIIEFYPYDGSDAELNKFYNDSLDIEKYIFNDLYPRTTGYINLSATGYGSVSSVLIDNAETEQQSYGAPTTPEYITFFGGPNIIEGVTSLKKMITDPSSSQYQGNNLYETNIYTSEGLISDYGTGTRESNLKSNFDTGVTVEFWSKTGSVGADPAQTTKQVLFDMWNNEVSSSAAYARLTIELTGGAGAVGPLLITAQSGNASASAERVLTSSIGQNLDFNDWNHYALAFYNSDSDFMVKLYVNGVLNDTNVYGALSAAATIVISDAGGISNGDTFTLVDSTGVSTVYTINGGVAPADGGGSGGSATVGFSGVGGGSAGKVAAAAAMVIAINATTDSNYTAVSNGVDTVTITQGSTGAAGNKTNSDSIASTTVSNFIGGVDSGVVAEFNSKNMMGRIGGLLTAPSGACDSSLVSSYSGAGKLSGSLDEFRFWKVKRDSSQIGRYWFDQVRGGVNSDISNANLGMYYKFNEGIMGTTAVDSVVLDYGGRLCNGTWTGYAAGSGSETMRNTGSAIVSASAASKEYLDPIIYSDHADVSSLRTSLLESGSWYDGQNTGLFKNLLPAWVIEESDAQEDSNLDRMCHVMGAYFDKLHAQITAVPLFKHHSYPSASEDSVPFAQHLPQSLGLYTPDIFIDSTIVEKFMDRSNSELFESSLHETKNLIYTNLYNNLANIFKAKGTERALRNTLRCFNLDDNLVGYNIYSNNQLFELKDNLKQTTKKKTFVNFSNEYNTQAVVYQSQNPHTASTRGYISGSTDTQKDGLTVEAGITFPRFFRNLDKIQRSFSTSSLFGMQTVNSAAYDDPAFMTGANEVVNFQVYAIRDKPYSKNVRFMLTSAQEPYPFPTLTSSDTFLNVYDEENWNFSVRLRPSNYPFADVISSSANYTYDIVFSGYNNRLGVIGNSFEATGTITKGAGHQILSASKRVYAGARNTNITGANIYRSDVLLSDFRYWTKYVDNTSLKQHTFDRDNAGITGSYRGISPLTSSNSYNYNTLALDWYFGEVTGSNSTGDFYVTDISSGSAKIRDAFGWVGKLAGHLHSGRGAGFGTSSAQVVQKDVVNDFKFINPERVVSSDQVQILSADDELFGVFDQIPNYVFTIEKSLYAALTDEILDFFAGAVDFHHLIGQPVNRYRSRYKEIEALRRVFFEKFQSIQTVERFTEYYKWFDDALALIMEQLVPASANFVPDVYNVIESHVLERNKYNSQYPTIEFQDEIDAAILGSTAADEPYVKSATGGPASSPRNVDKHIDYWLKKAKPGGTEGTLGGEISSGDTTVDINRAQLRSAIWRKRVTSGSSPRALTTVDGTTYRPDMNILNMRKGTSVFHQPKLVRTIKGGVNFERVKDIGYTYAALYPAGPVYHPGGAFIPQNVMVAYTDEMTKLKALSLREEEFGPSHLTKRHVGVELGRDYETGIGYDIAPSSMVFPFNIVSSSVSGGYNKRVIERVTGNIEVTNLHNDVYGPDMEVPMQGPFAEHNVGGHFSRHVPLNTGIDNYLNRPEAWKLLLGKCPDTSGALGMVGPDYPYPEANARDMSPYPLTGAQKAVYYRGMVAKRPFNLRNIQIKTGSSVLGNYTHNYEVVHTVGAYSNPKKFVENNASLQLPVQIFQNTATSSTQTRTFLDIHREDNSHFKFVDDYSISYLTAGPQVSSVIVSKFSNPGGLEVSPPGYRDFRSDEYSVYNAAPYRNLTVIKPSQGPSGTISQPTGAGGPGIRVFDIHGYDYGLRSQLARHTARFGRDSLWVTGTTSVFQASDPRSGAPGSHYNQLPGYHKINRNPLKRPRLCGATSTAATGSITMTGVPSDGHTLTIHYDASISKVYTWRNTPSQDGDVEIAPSANESAKKLNIAINSSYSTAFFTSTWDGASLVSVTNDKPGPSANIEITASPLNAWATLAGMAGGSELNEPTYCDSAEYDNFFVQHQIPRSDRQYAWITGAISESSDYRYYGFMPIFGPMMGRYSSSVGGIEPYFPFLSASDFGSYVGASAGRIWGTSRAVPVDGTVDFSTFLPTAFSNLNLNIYEPLTQSSNTLGYPSSTGVFNDDEAVTQYRNVTLVTMNVSEGPGNKGPTTGPAFNALMLKRNGPYGWGTFNQSHQSDHPVLRTERKNNKLSLIRATPTPEQFNLLPLSLKGRPVIVNYDYDTHKTVKNITTKTTENISLKTSYNNELIYFNQQSLNDYLDIDPSVNGEVTTFEQLVALRAAPDYNLNWIDYTECLYPSLRNEFSAYSSFRTGYDNKFWRTTLADRIAIGQRLSNSLGLYGQYAGGYAPFSDLFGAWISSSCWPLDAPQDFLTRTGPPVLKILGSSVYETSLRKSSSGGELQNTYGWWHLSASNPAINSELIMHSLSPAALYARKHTLNSPLSITSPGQITTKNQLGTYAAGFEFYPYALAPAGIPDPANRKASTGSGEAFWDAPTTAGYLTGTMATEGNLSGTVVTGFVSAASEPWFNDYDSFKADLKLKARGYSIIPEFRISEKVESYLRKDTTENFDTFEIPGTGRNSTEESFYIDYSNSDFMKNFLDIRNISDLSATEFRLTCHAAIRFNPYKGFYPAQRTLDLVSQFSRSFGKSIVIDVPAGAHAGSALSGAQASTARIIYQPLFAPGILYNSIKSGIACDWPIISNLSQSIMGRYNFTGSWSPGTDIEENGENYAWYPQYYDKYSPFVADPDTRWSKSPYKTGSCWTKRLPFETIITPEKYMLGDQLTDMEPHPAVAFSQSDASPRASLVSAPADSAYSLMASNFTAEVANFFLKGGTYTKLTSNASSLDKIRFSGRTNEVYGCRVRLKNSFEGDRTYQYESGALGNNIGYTLYGAAGFNSGTMGFDHVASGNLDLVLTGNFEIPQDPQYNPNFKRDFVMYSRTTAFGPPFSGRIPGAWLAAGPYGGPPQDGPAYPANAYVSGANSSTYGVRDCFNGYNWAFTPPHQHGEAWADLIFRPSGNVDYDLEKILQETQVVRWRHDPGPRCGTESLVKGIHQRTLVSDSPPIPVDSLPRMPNYGIYNSYNTNFNAMQLDDSVNLFGVENVYKQLTDKFGRVISNENEVVGKKWVIQPKFETPMLNFADVGIHPITGSGNTKTLPVFGDDTAANGMWHQFGTIPDSANKGVFIEIDDIPANWLQHHYLVVSQSSTYNGGAADRSLYKNMKSFGSLLGFEAENSKVRLGELATKQTIKEAIVAVPYVLENAQIDPKEKASDDKYKAKRFINIPSVRYNAAISEAEGSADGDSLDAAGVSIRHLVKKMKDYVLPPQFDFLQNTAIEPIVMYIFEFKYDLDRDDLSYIWQNLAPRNYKKMNFETQAVAHELFNTELLTEQNLIENPNLRWMVFKVKQKSQSMYTDITVRQASQAGSKLLVRETLEYPVRYNWPYDFISIVELAKIDAEVLYKERTPNTTQMKKTSDLTRTGKLATINRSLSRTQRVMQSTDLPSVATETAKVQDRKNEIAIKEMTATMNADATVRKQQDANKASELKVAAQAQTQEKRTKALQKSLKTTINSSTTKKRTKTSTKKNKKTKKKY